MATVVLGADFSVFAGLVGQGCVHAPHFRRTGFGGTRVLVIANQGLGTDTAPILTCVHLGTETSIVAGKGVWIEVAQASGTVATVIGAQVVVVTNNQSALDATSVGAK